MEFIRDQKYFFVYLVGKPSVSGHSRFDTVESNEYNDVRVTSLKYIPGRQFRKDTFKACSMGGKSTVVILSGRHLFQAQGYQRADHITSDELALIKKVDRQPRAKTESVLLSDGKTYALLYLRLLKKLERIDTRQCILVLIADALAGSSTSQLVS